MPAFSELLQQGTASAWLFLPTAVLLGALHGLEPGHSKTLIAAFIIAVRGTMPQAVLLGLSAMVSHTAIIWILAIASLTWGREYLAEDMEPALMLVSGVIIMALAGWMFFQTRRAADPITINAHEHQAVAAASTAGDGTVRTKHRHHHDDHDHHPASLGHIDSHQIMHARQIEENLAGGRRVTPGQVVLFGLSGGLLPCTAALAVLLICMQVQQFALGMAMVGAFSLGLAIALVGVGVLAAWGAGKVSRRFTRFNDIARKLPYLSSLIVFAIAVVMMANGWHHLDPLPR